MNKEFFARKKDINELKVNKANVSDVYTKTETDNKIIEKVTEIVADAPEDFDTLKEMSDWISNHEESAAAMNTAINGKVDKEEGKSLISDLEITRLSDVKNYDDTKVKGDIAVNYTTLGIQHKNLLKHSAITQTINGITFTVNDDRSITANGTATANAVFKFATLTLKAGTYKYSGLSIIPSASTANMSVFRMSDWAGLCALAEKDTFTITADTKVECRAVIYNGYTAANVVFYPMLRYVDIQDDTYEPYQPSLQEQIAALEARIAALEG